MAFADGKTVRDTIEKLLLALYEDYSKPTHNAVQIPCLATSVSPKSFPLMTYSVAMLKHGTDKPDLRIKGLVSWS